MPLAAGLPWRHDVTVNFTRRSERVVIAEVGWYSWHEVAAEIGDRDRRVVF